MSTTGGGWDTGKVPLQLCPDPAVHEVASLSGMAAYWLAGHRTDQPHDCFVMNCSGLMSEVESLWAALTALEGTDRLSGIRRAYERGATAEDLIRLVDAAIAKSHSPR